MSTNADLPAARQEQINRMVDDFRKRDRHERRAILDYAEEHADDIYQRLRQVEGELNGRRALIMP